MVTAKEIAEKIRWYLMAISSDVEASHYFLHNAVSGGDPVEIKRALEDFRKNVRDFELCFDAYRIFVELSERNRGEEECVNTKMKEKG